MNFQEEYNKIVKPVDNEISKVIDNLSNIIKLEEPLKSKVSTIINAPSKHIRSTVSFLFLKAIGKDIDERQINLQTAIELVHNASLIHDDIIDESSVRRKVQTINSSFGNKMGVISGDYILSVALNKICKLKSFEIIELFSTTLDEMCQGEVNQYFNKFQIPTLKDYIKKTEQKTAKLFETAMCSSAILSESKISPKEFAKNFGIAFQIRDDLINIQTTKTDINDGIYTAPIIFSGSIEQFENGIEKTKTLLNNYINRAIKSIDKIEENVYKVALLKLLELLENG